MRCLGQKRKRRAKPEQAKKRRAPRWCGHQLIQPGQQHTKDKAGQMRQRRVLERLQPRAPAPAVRMRNAVGVEDDVQRAGNQAQHPHARQLGQMRPARSGRFQRAIHGNST